MAALGLIVIYSYSVGTFALLPNEFHTPNEDDADNVLFCRSLIQCFISVLEYGLLDTIGLVSLIGSLYILKLTSHVYIYRLQLYQQTLEMLQ